VARLDTKKAYLNFLNTIMSSNLGSVFVSQSKPFAIASDIVLTAKKANITNLVPFLETILQMATDTSDPLNEKLALIFVTKFISLFGHATQPANGAGTAANGVIIVPGIDQFIYQRVLVVAFQIPFLPDFNLKDGQSIAVSVHPALIRNDVSHQRHLGP
jgi:exportin-T